MTIYRSQEKIVNNDLTLRKVTKYTSLIFRTKCHWDSICIKHYIDTFCILKIIRNKVIIYLFKTCLLIVALSSLWVEYGEMTMQSTCNDSTKEVFIICKVLCSTMVNLKFDPNKFLTLKGYNFIVDLDFTHKSVF